MLSVKSGNFYYNRLLPMSFSPSHAQHSCPNNKGSKILHTHSLTEPTILSRLCKIYINNTTWNKEPDLYPWSLNIMLLSMHCVILKKIKIDLEIINYPDIF